MSDQLAAGTPITDALSGYTNYTAEQLATLETLKDRAYTFGIAGAEHANKVVHPDGTISTDTAPIIAAAKSALEQALAGEITSLTLKVAAAAAQKVEEIVGHIAQKRFVFFVDRDHLPTVYFQAATPTNPEALNALSPHADDHPVLVADHPDPEAHAAQAAEVSSRIAGVIAAAKSAANQEG